MNKKKNKAKIIILSVVAFLVACSAFVLGFYWFQSRPVDDEDKSLRSITIPLGQGTKEIGATLEKEGVLRSGALFPFIVRLEAEKGLQAGKYELSPSMSAQEIVQQLQTGVLFKEPALKLTIPEGTNIDGIIDIMMKNTDHSEEELLAFFKDKTFVEQLIKKDPEFYTEEMIADGIRYPLEGYLFPSTYSYEEKNLSIEQLIHPMLDKMKVEMAAFDGKRKALDFTTHEFLTFSSLIEKEATAKMDRSKISSVFFNRLAIDMPLQTDPTVLYALGRHKDRVLYEDLKIESPYNTYKNKGIPIGPIASPSVPSMVASTAPSETDYLYFLANRDGEVFFAKTYEEHLALKREHISN
ncbi:MAG: endolytic transglycosylase MltG [Bacilli bacterium]